MPESENLPQFSAMTISDLLGFFEKNPECDEYTWVNGSKIRFSDVLRKALEEIEDAHFEGRSEAAMNYDG